MSFDALSLNTRGCIGPFLDDTRDLAKIAPVSRNFQSSVAFKNREWFLLDVGALTPSDKTDFASLWTEHNNLRLFKSLKPESLKSSFLAFEGPALKVHDWKSAGIFDTLAYYFGIQHESLADNFATLSQKKATQIDELIAMKPPNRLNEFRNICFRAKNLEREIASMKELIAASASDLDAATAELFCLARWIAQFAQWVVCYFMQSPEKIKQIDAAFTPLQTDGGKLSALARGKFKETPDAWCGVRIGETYIDPKRLVGVYAFPRNYAKSDTGELVFSGDVVFVLSETGKSEDWRADCAVARIWQDRDKGWGISEDYTVDKPKAIFARRLELTSLRERGADTPYFAVNGDRPFMRKLSQLAVEILLREGEKRMTYCNAYDYAHVLIPAGFQARRDKKIKETKIIKKIKEARERGRRFPNYHDEAMFNMQLRNKPLGSLLDTPVDWGEGARTWRSRLQTEPMLWGTGAILPRYWRQNIYLLEKRT